MSYPTHSQISEMYQLQISNPEQFLEKYVDPNVKLTITGHKHEFSGEVSGKADLVSKHITPIVSLLDKEKSPLQREVVMVIGGGDSPWAAVALRTTGTTKVGKPWDHENCYLIHFNNEGKIDEMRGYYDSAHLNKHVADAKA